MLDLDKYYKARDSLDGKFRGIPYAHGILINQLIARANLVSGITSDISYNDLANLLTVNPAPGRKESGTPTKQTIRNYIKSIERECGDHFKVISEGQSLKFYFPDMPKLFANLVNNIEENTELNTEDNQKKSGYRIENIEESWKWLDELDIEVNTDLNIEVNTPNEPVKNIKNINNNNNNNTRDVENFSNTPKSKKPIAPDFYPSAEILIRAFAAGYHFAAEPQVIQEFIDKNTSWGSQFADFNPVYFNYLSQYDKFQQKKLQAETSQLTRSTTNERHTSKINSHAALMARTIQANPNAIAPSATPLPATESLFTEDDEAYSQSHRMALA